MDMWEPYVRSTLAHLPEAARKIVFDKFHVAQHLGKAVDEVQRREQRSCRHLRQRNLRFPAGGASRTAPHLPARSSISSAPQISPCSGKSVV